MFCGQMEKYNGKKRGFDIMFVRIKDFQDLIRECVLVKKEKMNGQMLSQVGWNMCKIFMQQIQYIIRIVV